MSKLLEVRNLSKSYGDFTLYISNLSIEPGEVVGIVGRNGAGKTTFIDLVLNERERDSGSISVLGMDNIEHEAEIKQQVGFVIDDAGFDQKFTLAEAGKVLSYIYRDWDDSYFAELLHDFNLSAKAKIGELSKGMAAKGKLALALAHRPQLTFLDEITSGLDPVSRLDVLKLLKAYIDADVTRGLVYSTHITDDLMRLADKVMLLEEGAVVSFDPISAYETGPSIDTKMAAIVEGERESA